MMSAIWSIQNAESLPFNLQNPGKTASMPVLRHIAGSEERINNFKCQLGTDNPAPNAKNVHVIMLDSLMRRVRIMTNSSTNARNFVGGHADSHTTAADDNSAVSTPLNNLLGNRDGKVRVITALDAIGATISQ